jgi:hypothetical protein
MKHAISFLALLIVSFISHARISWYLTAGYSNSSYSYADNKYPTSYNANSSIFYGAGATCNIYKLPLSVGAEVTLTSNDVAITQRMKLSYYNTEKDYTDTTKTNYTRIAPYASLRILDKKFITLYSNLGLAFLYSNTNLVQNQLTAHGTIMAGTHGIFIRIGVEQSLAGFNISHVKSNCFNYHAGLSIFPGRLVHSFIKK